MIVISSTLYETITLNYKTFCYGNSPRSKISNFVVSLFRTVGQCVSEMTDSSLLPFWQKYPRFGHLKSVSSGLRTGNFE